MGSRYLVDFIVQPAAASPIDQLLVSVNSKTHLIQIEGDIVTLSQATGENDVLFWLCVKPSATEIIADPDSSTDVNTYTNEDSWYILKAWRVNSGGGDVNLVFPLKKRYRKPLREGDKIYLMADTDSDSFYISGALEFVFSSESIEIEGGA